MKQRILFALSSTLVVAIFGAPTAHAAHALHSQAQVCDDLYGFDSALQCKSGTQGPAVPGGVEAVEDDNYVRKDPDSNAVVISFRGLVQGFSNYGRATLNSIQQMSFGQIPSAAGPVQTKYAGTAAASADFSDVLTFSKGTQARLTFTVAIGVTLGAGGGKQTTSESLVGVSLINDPLHDTLHGNYDAHFNVRQVEDNTFELSGGDGSAGQGSFKSVTCSGGILVAGACGELSTGVFPIAQPVTVTANAVYHFSPYNVAPGPGSLSGGASIDLVLSKIEVFDATGAPIAQFAVTSESGSTYPLQAPSIPAPSLSLASNNVVFTATPVGAMSAPQVISVSNTGGAALAINTLSFAGADSSSFGLSSDTCSNATLASNAACSFTLKFAPSGAHGTKSASLSIGSNDAHSPTTLTLVGQATAPIISTSSTSLTLDPTLIGQTSAAQALTVTNTGDAPLLIGTLVTDGANAAEFVVSENCSGRSLDPNTTCVIDVTEKPASTGAKSATLTINSNSSTQTKLAVALNGSGITPTPAPSPTPSPAPGGGAIDLISLIVLLGALSFRRHAPALIRSNLLCESPR